MWFIDPVMTLLPDTIRAAPMLDVAIYGFIVFAAAVFFLPLSNGGLFGLVPRAPFPVRVALFVIAACAAALVLFVAAILVQPYGAPCTRAGTLADWYACMQGSAG